MHPIVPRMLAHAVRSDWIFRLAKQTNCTTVRKMNSRRKYLIRFGFNRIAPVGAPNTTIGTVEAQQRHTRSVGPPLARIRNETSQDETAWLTTEFSVMVVISSCSLSEESGFQTKTHAMNTPTTMAPPPMCALNMPPKMAKSIIRRYLISGADLSPISTCARVWSAGLFVGLGSSSWTISTMPEVLVSSSPRSVALPVATAV
mmetsp:Transcript_15381/g.38164  ORF Transcript_15381/g.38164 Transcript_15381/m.38164 type:complete len:202 (-) Transcript_15381:716-1321(-)